MIFHRRLSAFSALNSQKDFEVSSLDEVFKLDFVVHLSKSKTFKCFLVEVFKEHMTVKVKIGDSTSVVGTIYI